MLIQVLSVPLKWIQLPPPPHPLPVRLDFHETLQDVSADKYLQVHIELFIFTVKIKICMYRYNMILYFIILYFRPEDFHLSSNIKNSETEQSKVYKTTKDIIFLPPTSSLQAM